MNVLLDTSALLALARGDLPRRAAAGLPLIHRDPFDRVLVALAQAQALTVLTSDENIGRYPGVKTLW